MSNDCGVLAILAAKVAKVAKVDLKIGREMTMSLGHSDFRTYRKHQASVSNPQRHRGHRGHGKGEDVPLLPFLSGQGIIYL